MTTTTFIHVVDDDEPVRTALLRLLNVAGFEPRGYGSAGDLLLHPMPNDRPGCVLLDLHLPGPSGLDLQSALQRQGIALPVIFLTGCGDVSSSVRAMKGGAVDFLTKPVEPISSFRPFRARSHATSFSAASAAKRIDCASALPQSL
jgi:FixJ family two-component response regulator